MTVPELLEHYKNTLTQFGVWPGFEPQSIPLTLFDGKDTYLWRHPDPTEPFKEVAHSSDLYIMPGRHDKLVANSLTEINGVTTATLFYNLEDKQMLLPQLLALMVHEAFHVYQQAAFHQAQANEMDLFIYPLDDTDLLIKRRLETYALGKALKAKDKAAKAVWAATALDYRSERFSQMAPTFVAYERLTELREGTAFYIENKLAARAVHLPLDGFATTHVRQRCYQTGAAFCSLLETFAFNWQQQVENSNETYLDILLAEALAELTVRKRLDAATVLKLQNSAHKDTERLQRERKQLRAKFDAAGSWKLSVIASSERPLELKGFDPLNVSVVEGGVLHKRYLNLASDKGRLEVFGAQCLTESFGELPLYSGVKRVTVQLKTKPSIKLGQSVQVKTDGFTASFAQARVRQEGHHITIELEGA